VQFIKGRMVDRRGPFPLARFPELVTIRTMGEGFTWETQDRTRDRRRGPSAPGRRHRPCSPTTISPWSFSMN